jgi:hypothetical protein
VKTTKKCPKCQSERLLVIEHAMSSTKYRPDQIASMAQSGIRVRMQGLRLYRAVCPGSGSAAR